MSTATMPVRALLSARQVTIVAIVLSALAVLVTVPPLSVETFVVPSLLILLALVCTGWAWRRGDSKGAAYAGMAVVAGYALALTIQAAQQVTIEGIVTAGLFAATLRFATPLVF